MKAEAAGHAQYLMQVVPKGRLLCTPLQHVWTVDTQLKHSSQLLCFAASQADVVAWAIDSWLAHEGQIISNHYVPQHKSPNKSSNRAETSEAGEAHQIAG